MIGLNYTMGFEGDFPENTIRIRFAYDSHTIFFLTRVLAGVEWSSGFLDICGFLGYHKRRAQIDLERLP